MSLLKRPFDSLRSRWPTNFRELIPVIQVRTATKRASGSKTNKNDSAGRRLGPKVHESNFVKPGQIIMRQRGTKIHPGENTGIGKDHTIFALEPGFIRFYFDPFHPMRKFVGVALKKDLTLPTPHFSPRIRRFGYVEITDAEEALKEESHMSRKEYLQQPEIKQMELRRQQRDESLIEQFKTQLPHYVSGYPQVSEGLILSKLLSVHKLTRLGQSIEDANRQTKFDYIYSTKLELLKGSITKEEYSELKDKYIKLADDIDSKVCVDLNGNLTKFLSESERLDKRSSILTQLTEFENKLITKELKESVIGLIETPLIFNSAERATLTKKYLPSILPETVEETVVTGFNEKKPPKGVKVVRKFDNQAKQMSVIGRTTEAFL